MSILEELSRSIPAVDHDSAEAARRRHDQLAKPPGSLGRLEEVAARLAAIAGACPPPLPASPAVLIAAGDHGVHAQGVTMWPQAVSTAVVGAIADGTATSSVLAAGAGATVTVLDVGLAAPPLSADTVLRRARVRDATRDLTEHPAMTIAEMESAVTAGADSVMDLVDGGADLLVLGEVGIANTTPTAALAAVLTGAPADEVTGRGAGSDDPTLRRKITAVEAGLRRHGTDDDPAALLASLGGLEHAALVGSILAAAARRIPVLLDGVTTVVAAVLATRLVPDAGGYLLAGHRSTEPATDRLLHELDLEPLLDLELRLGEGTGGLLAVPLVQAAVRVLRDVGLLTEL